VEFAYASDPMMNSTEKDLVRCAEDAGFGEVHVERGSGGSAKVGKHEDLRPYYRRPTSTGGSLP
jgi:hypothetical protein